MQLLKQPLLVAVIYSQIVRNIVRNISRVAAYYDIQQHLRRQIAGELQILVEHSDAGTHERILLRAFTALDFIRH